MMICISSSRLKSSSSSKTQDAPILVQIQDFYIELLLQVDSLINYNETFTYDALNRLTGHATPLGSFTNTFLGQKTNSRGEP